MGETSGYLVDPTTAHVSSKSCASFARSQVRSSLRSLKRLSKSSGRSKRWNSKTPRRPPTKTSDTSVKTDCYSSVAVLADYGVVSARSDRQQSAQSSHVLPESGNFFTTGA